MYGPPQKTKEIFISLVAAAHIFAADQFVTSQDIVNNKRGAPQAIRDNRTITPGTDYYVSQPGEADAYVYQQSRLFTNFGTKFNFSSGRITYETDTGEFPTGVMTDVSPAERADLAEHGLKLIEAMRKAAGGTLSAGYERHERVLLEQITPERKKALGYSAQEI